MIETERRKQNEFTEFVLRAGADEPIYEIPAEYPKLIRAGTEYADLILRDGYKRLLDDLEREADLLLGQLKECQSSDGAIIRGLRDKWAAYEAVLKFIQIRVQAAIDTRKSILEELATQVGEDALIADLSESGATGLDFAISSVGDPSLAQFMESNSGISPISDAFDEYN